MKKYDWCNINGDGNPDVVVTSPGDTNAVGWFENDGTPLVASWALRLIAYPFDGAAGTAVGDLNGDGTLDVLSAQLGGMIRWWENIGAGVLIRSGGTDPSGTDLCRRIRVGFD